jgi:hypothetical protein
MGTCPIGWGVHPPHSHTSGQGVHGETFMHIPLFVNMRKHMGKCFPGVGDVFSQNGDVRAPLDKKGDA